MQSSSSNLPIFDWSDILFNGALDLGANFEQGEYLLQPVVRDRQAKETYGTATQWIDFEVAK